ncbi:MAG: hypothetical protein Q7S98_06505 [Deltaproteobacteria bacterium]|nr:hypothetical protein [Deltaproteobacteria bacterium]
MPEPSDYLEEVGLLIESLESIGFKPILVGGMALVMLGSRRVTRDFDFLVSEPEERLDQVISAFYERGLELASRLNKNGEVTATIDNPKVAAIRLRLDKPSSAYFYHPKTGLRVDLLFDFPLVATELATRARKMKVRSYSFRVASEDDLIRLKEIAKSERSSPGDAEDLAFLKARRKGSK